MVSVGTIVWLSSELMFFAGLFVIFLAERTVSSEQLQRVLDLLGSAIMVGMIATLVGRRNSARDPEEKTAYGWLLLSAVSILAGVGVYFLFASKSPAS